MFSLGHLIIPGHHRIMKIFLLLLPVITLTSGCAMIHTESHQVSGGQSVSVEVERMWPGWDSRGFMMMPTRNEHAEVQQVMAFSPSQLSTNIIHCLLRKDAHLLASALTFPPPQLSTNVVQYAFALKWKDAHLPASIKVEDVTDAQPVVLVEDPNPTSTDWEGMSAVLPLNDPNLAWVQSTEDAIRIYCFTVVSSSGEQIRFYQAVNYSYHFTALLRRYFADRPNRH